MQKTNVSIAMHPQTDWNLSFAGCGFLSLYHIGVCACLETYAPHLLRCHAISGASAGAIFGACMLCRINLQDYLEKLMSIFRKITAFTLGPFDPRFRIDRELRHLLADTLPPDAHLICTGSLRVSMTKFPTGANVNVSHFDTREELITALLCSSFIPGYSGVIPPTFRGQWMIDGGLSDNQPRINERTIRVSPFSGQAEISPMDLAGLGHLVVCNTSLTISADNAGRLWRIVSPESSDALAQLAQQGYRDTVKFLRSWKGRQIYGDVTAAANAEDPDEMESELPQSLMDIFA